MLADMPGPARRAALLVYFAGYPLRELAEALDRPADELRGALHAAMTILVRDPRTRPALTYGTVGLPGEVRDAGLV